MQNLHPILELDVFQNYPSLLNILEGSISRIHEIRNYDFEPHVSLYDKFCHLISLLNTLECQFEIIDSILKGRTFENPYPSLEELKIEAITEDKLSHAILSHMITYIKKSILDRIYEVIRTKSKISFFGEEFSILTSKIEAIIKTIPYAIKISASDVFFAIPDSQRLVHLSSFITLKSLGTKDKVINSYEKFLAQLFIGNATIIEGHKQNHQLMKIFFKYFTAPYYLMRPKTTKRLIELFISKPNECVFEAWDIFDDPVIAPIFNLIIPGIKVNKLIEIERKYPEINFETVENAVKNNLWKEETKENPFFVSSPNIEKSKIPIRILSPYALPNKSKSIEALVIHIHGGGWVSMSSHSHQIYSRRWALQLGLPVFSIDYRLAPKFKYPAGLDDCWQAYNWLIDNAHSFGINPKKVILTGESAGGNLALAITNLAIRTGKRVPDGLYLAYPGLYLSEKYYTPSFIKAMDDGLVAYSYLTLFLKAYLPKAEIGECDPLASPVIAPEWIMKSYPPLRLSVGTGDPLHDECWRLSFKLKSLDRNVGMTSYYHMPHGFMLNCIPGGMKESLVCIEDAGNYIKELINLN